MKLLARGRDGDIFEFAPGLVLRRTRSGRSIAHEARTMRYAAEQGLSEEQAIKRGMEEKSKEFVERGAEVYAKA